MANQRIINTKFWDDSYIIKLDPTEKLLFLYFLTNPLTNISGIYEISLKRVAFDTGIDSEMVDKILGRFEKDNKMLYRNNWICIINFIKNQNLNPSVIAGIEREISEIPEEVFRNFEIRIKKKSFYHQKQIPNGQRKRILKRDNFACSQCGCKEKLEIDHIIPVWKGGENKDDNLRILCQKCNLERNKEYHEQQSGTAWDRLRQAGILNLTKLNLTKENAPATASFKKQKPYFRGDEMRKKNNKWWVLPKDGSAWLEFAGKEKEITWK